MATHADTLLQDQMAPTNVIGGGGMLVRPNHIHNNKRPTSSVVPTLLPNSFGGCCSKEEKKKKAVLDSTAKVMMITTDRKFSSSTSCNISNLQGLCFMCKKGDQLLICTTQGCPIQIHASCLACLPTTIDDDDDDTGKFYCPPCSYNRATSERQEAEKEVALAVEKALSAKQSLSLFVNHYSNNHDNKHERGRMKSKYSSGVAGNPQKTTISTACTNGDEIVDPISRKEALKAAITLNNFLLQYEKNTPQLLNSIRNIRDEIQLNLTFNRNSVEFNIQPKTYKLVSYDRFIF